MDKKFLWSSAALYASLAVCLIAIAAGGWFLLFGRTPQAEPAEPVFQPAAESSAAANIPEEPVETLPPPAETIEPTAQVIMPEEPIDEDPLPVFDPTPVVAEPPQIIVEPLVGEVVAAFSVNELQYDPTFQDWRIHNGVDIGAALGAAVLSASGGRVSSVTEDPLMGVTVVIDHDDGYRTTYSNLAKDPQVTAGEQVSAGAVIGVVGDTALAESARGSHLHFSVSLNGDVIDPKEYLYR